MKKTVCFIALSCVTISLFAYARLRHVPLEKKMEYANLVIVGRPVEIITKDNYYDEETLKLNKDEKVRNQMKKVKYFEAKIRTLKVIVGDENLKDTHIQIPFGSHYEKDGDIYGIYGDRYTGVQYTGYLTVGKTYFFFLRKVKSKTVENRYIISDHWDYHEIYRNADSKYCIKDGKEEKLCDDFTREILNINRQNTSND